MQARSAILLVLFFLLALFSILNWGAFMAPTHLSLGVADIEAPLGLIMLGFVVLVTALFVIFVLYLQTTVLLDSRRHSKELQSQRLLADKAEASRFTELRALVQSEILTLKTQQDSARTELLGQIQQLEQNLREQVESTGNTLSAYIGELEDRVERSESSPAG